MRKHSKNKKPKIKFKDRDVFYKITIYRRIAFVFGLIATICLFGFVGNLDKVPLWVTLATTLSIASISLTFSVLSKYLSKKYSKFKPPMTV